MLHRWKVRTNYRPTKTKLKFPALILHSTEELSIEISKTFSRVSGNSSLINLFRIPNLPIVSQPALKKRNEGHNSKINVEYIRRRVFLCSLNITSSVFAYKNPFYLNVESHIS